MTRHLFGFFLVLQCLFTMSVLPVCAAAAEPANAYNVESGEIRFDGVLAAIDTQAGKITITVSSFTLPSGKSNVLDPPKPKVVSLEGARIINSGDGEVVLPDALQIGTPVVVVGKDTGTGKEMTARLLAATLDGLPLEEAPAIFQEDKNQVSIHPGETRYDGKISGVLSAMTFAVTVVATTDNTGQTVELAEPQQRTVQVTPETVIRAREDAARLMSMRDLKVGLRVTLSGKMAANRIVAAREVAVWDASEGRRRSLGVVTISATVSRFLTRGDQEQRARTFESAVKWYQQALDAAINASDVPGQAMAYGRMALTFDDMGQPMRALESFQKALAIWKRTGNAGSEAITYMNLSGFYLRREDIKSAREAIDNTIRLYGGSANTRALAIAYSRLGQIQNLQGENEQAVESWQNALNMARQSQERDEEITVLGRLAVGYAKLRQAARAQEVVTQLIALLPQISGKNEAAQAHYMIGMAYKDSGQAAQAKEYLTRAQALWNEAGMRDAAGGAQKQLDELGGATVPVTPEPMAGGIVPDA